jgi:hypothetical protein
MNAPTLDKEWLRLCGIMGGRSVPCEVLENPMRRHGDALACRESRGGKSTSAITGIHICRSKGNRNGGRHEPVGLVRRAKYVTSKTATSALGVVNLKCLNGAAQSGYASGVLSRSAGSMSALKGAQSHRDRISRVAPRSTSLFWAGGCRVERTWGRDAPSWNRAAAAILNCGRSCIATISERLCELEAALFSEAMDVN